MINEHSPKWLTGWPISPTVLNIVRRQPWLADEHDPKAAAAAFGRLRDVLLAHLLDAYPAGVTGLELSRTCGLGFTSRKHELTKAGWQIEVERMEEVPGRVFSYRIIGWSDPDGLPIGPAGGVQERLQFTTPLPTRRSTAVSRLAAPDAPFCCWCGCVRCRPTPCCRAHPGVFMCTPCREDNNVYPSTPHDPPCLEGVEAA